MDLADRLEALEQRLGLLEDREEIGRLQRIYGYYIDNRMWAEMADLFADQGASIEIGRRGRYLGKARIRAFLDLIMGGGRRGLNRHEVINHMQHQLVISVDPDRRRARARARAVVMASPPRDQTSGGAPLWPQDHWMLAEGVYENSYVREGGTWKIEALSWAPTFYVRIPGWDTAWFESGPPSEEMAPDAPSLPAEETLGRAFLPFHFDHPVTAQPTRFP
jgi:hypothetical protein